MNGFRGANGGYMLARNPSEITVGEVVRCAEGPLTPVVCRIRGEECTRAPNCAVRLFWQELGETIRQFLDSTSLSDLVTEESLWRGWAGDRGLTSVSASRSASPFWVGEYCCESEVAWKNGLGQGSRGYYVI